jgi:hypothetical protein
VLNEELNMLKGYKLEMECSSARILELENMNSEMIAEIEKL